MLLSGAFLLALILAGILVAVLGGGGGGQGQRRTQPQVSVRPSTPSSTPTSSHGMHAPRGLSQAVPSVSPPAGTHWSTVGSMQIPQAPNLYGPQRTQGVFNRCFAHNPSGALLAAINLCAEDTAADPISGASNTSPLAPRQPPGTNRLDAAVRCSSRATATTPIRPATPICRSSFAGPRASSVAIVTPMTWAGNDWKYVFPPQRSPVTADPPGPHRLRAMERRSEHPDPRGSRVRVISSSFRSSRSAC